MNLYLVSITKKSGLSWYDTYDSIVVAAKSSKKARATHPYQERPDGYDGGCWVTKDKIDTLDVEYIGKAKSGTKEGVIISSFNAA